MPRLGIPHNIDWVSACFRQPGEGLNPLRLVWPSPQAVVLERVRTGSRMFRACWFFHGHRNPLGLPADALIVLCATVAELFEEQMEPWKAYRCDGREEPLIGEEIAKQLEEFYRRMKRRSSNGAVVYQGQRNLPGCA